MYEVFLVPRLSFVDCNQENVRIYIQRFKGRGEGRRPQRELDWCQGDLLFPWGNTKCFEARERREDSTYEEK